MKINLKALILLPFFVCLSCSASTEAKKIKLKRINHHQQKIIERVKQQAALSSGFYKINAHESAQDWPQVEKIRKSMQRYNIGHSVLIGHYDEVYDESKAWNTKTKDFANNNFVMQVIKKYPGQFSAICMVHPHDAQVLEKMDRFLAEGAAGFQVYDFMFTKGLDKDRYDFFFQYLEQKQIPLALRTSVINHGTFCQVDSLLNKYRQLKIIIPHYMVCEEEPWRIRYLMEKHSNLYFDLSYGFKNWRAYHLNKVSENSDALRKIIVRFQDRVCFGTDVVVSAEKWKTQEYIDASYQDYINFIEKKELLFSVTGKKLKGFQFDDQIKRKIYHQNYLNLYQAKIEKLAEKQILLKQIPEGFLPDAKGDALFLLTAAMLHPFSSITDISWTEKGPQLPSEINQIAADKKLKPFWNKAIKVDYWLPLDKLKAKIRQNKNILGICSLDDLFAEIKSPSLNRNHPLFSQNRAHVEKLANYPLCLYLGKGSADSDYQYNPYDYLSVNITGSSLIGQGLSPDASLRDLDKLIAQIKEQLQNADLTQLSQETAFSVGKKNDLRNFYFISEDHYWPLLPAMGVDIISLTGNHLSDFGSAQLARSLQLYKKRNLYYYGGGKNNSENETTLKLNFLGRDLAFCGFNAVSWGNALAAPGRAGTLAYQGGKSLQLIKTMEKKSDFLFVDFQAGTEFCPEASYQQRRMATLAVSAGAQAVNFLHSHSIKGYEFINDAFIGYGPGNFLFHHPTDENDSQNAYFLRFYLDGPQIKQVRFFPIYIDDHQIKKGDYGKLMQKLEKIDTLANQQRADLKITSPYWPKLSPDYLNYTLRSDFNITIQKLPVKIKLKKINAPAIQNNIKLKNKEYWVLDFDNLDDLGKLLQLCQEERKKVRQFFLENRKRIIFAPYSLFKKVPYRYGNIAVGFYVQQLLRFSRDFLEKKQLYLPVWDLKGGEWFYNYADEKIIQGLDLPADVLEDIYNRNMKSLFSQS